MTIHHIGCTMAARDFHICRMIVKTAAGSDFAYVHDLRRKLDGATVVDESEIDPLVITLNSRVTFQVDDESPQTRILVGSEFRNGLVGLTLPLSTPRGTALLGLRQGQACRLEESGRSRQIRVLRIAWQPQAARFGRATTQNRHDGNGARIVDLAYEREERMTHPSRSRPFAEGRHK